MVDLLVLDRFQITSVLIFVIGFANLLIQKNLIKKILGLVMMDSAIFLFLAAIGYVDGGVPPLIVNGVLEPQTYINPVPSSLLLTGLIVSVCVLSFSLALTLRLYQKHHTLNIDDILLAPELPHKKEGGN